MPYIFMEEVMKIVSFNVNGIRAILSKNFKEDFKNINADILSINETKLSEDLFKDNFPFNPEGYYVYYTNSKIRKGYSGVAVFTKLKPISVHYGLEENKYDDEGRVVTLEYDNFYYVACYVPNSGDELKRLDFRMIFEKDLVDYLNKLDEIKPVIYAGDLNVAHQEIDLKNPKSNERNAGFTIEERMAFSNLLQNGYIDTFRYFNKDVVKYSWWSYRFNARKNNAGWRIDYVIVSQRIIGNVHETFILNEIEGSDHCPVGIVIDL